MIYTSPIWKLGNPPHEISFVGEVGPKWVNVSPQRVEQIIIDTDYITIDLNGVPGEVLELHYTLDQKPHDQNCTVPIGGKVSINFENAPNDGIHIYCQDA